MTFSIPEPSLGVPGGLSGSGKRQSAYRRGWPGGAAHFLFFDESPRRRCCGSFVGAFLRTARVRMTSSKTGITSLSLVLPAAVLLARMRSSDSTVTRTSPTWMATANLSSSRNVPSPLMLTTRSKGSLPGPPSIGGFNLNGGTHAAPAACSAAANLGSINSSTHSSTPSVTTGASCRAPADNLTIMKGTRCRTSAFRMRGSVAESGEASATAEAPVQSFKWRRLKNDSCQLNVLGIGLGITLQHGHYIAGQRSSPSDSRRATHGTVLEVSPHRRSGFHAHSLRVDPSVVERLRVSCQQPA